MPFFKTDDIQAWTGGSWTLMPPNKRPEIRGFTNDSRNVEKDFAFVALKGRRDGHDFAADAVANGASAVIAERELDLAVPVLVVDDSLSALQKIAQFHRRRFENPVVAVSGSCGKTSTKEMLAALAAWKNPLVTEGNLNNQIGVPLTLTKIDLRQNQLAIIEAGVSGPGQMGELAEMIEPDISIVTSVGVAHMEKFGEIGNVAKEKSILPASNVNGWCVMHHNLLSWKSFDELKCKKVILAPENAPDIKADIVFRYALIDLPDCIGLDMSVEDGNEYYFEVPHMSRGMIDNTLLSVATALMLGAKEEQVAVVLRGLKPLPMRGSVAKFDENAYYIDCYNASPVSMRDALSRFEELVPQGVSKLYLLGSMSELGLARHRHHKDIASRITYAEGYMAILVGESANIYKDGLIEAGWPEDSIEILDDYEKIKSKLDSFKGWIFVKGSRAWALEKSLPQHVIDKIESESAEDEGDSVSEPEEIPEQEPQTPDAEDDEDDDSFDNSEDLSDEDDNSENDDEDEREGI